VVATLGKLNLRLRRTRHLRPGRLASGGSLGKSEMRHCLLLGRRLTAFRRRLLDGILDRLVSRFDFQTTFGDELAAFQRFGERIAALGARVAVRHKSPFGSIRPPYAVAKIESRPPLRRIIPIE